MWDHGLHQCPLYPRLLYISSRYNYTENECTVASSRLMPTKSNVASCSIAFYTFSQHCGKPQKESGTACMTAVNLGFFEDTEGSGSRTLQKKKQRIRCLDCMFGFLKCSSWYLDSQFDYLDNLSRYSHRTRYLWYLSILSWHFVATMLSCNF